MEEIRVSNSTDALLYRILDRICFQTSVLDQLLATQQATLNVLPSIGQQPAQASTNESTQVATTFNQAVSNPKTSVPTGFIGTSDYPIPIIMINPTFAVYANTALLSPNSFKVQAISTINIAVCLDSTGSPAYPLVTRDNGSTFAALNLANNMIVGVDYQFSVMLFPRDIFDISFSADTIIQYLRIAYTYSI